MSNLLHDCGYYYVGGTLAGFAGTMISQPFDTCKVHLQTKRPINFRERSFIQNVNWAYRGATPSIIGLGIEKSLVFGTYMTMCNLFQLDEHNVYHTFAAGLVSGLAASLSITAAEQLKTDKQLGKPSRYNLGYLYKGLGYTSAREGIGFSIYFTAYNQLNKYFNQNDKDTFGIKLLKSGALGACSAFIAWIPIYPIDINKTRIQSGDLFGKGLLTEFKQARGLGKIKIFYGGYHIAMMRAVPFHATCFMVFEVLKYYKPVSYKLPEFETHPFYFI
jgi:solute carrier family 25 carnitine/acylcarnitine transporter 20/29